MSRIGRNESIGSRYFCCRSRQCQRKEENFTSFPQFFFETIEQTVYDSKRAQKQQNLVCCLVSWSPLDMKNIRKITALQTHPREADICVFERMFIVQGVDVHLELLHLSLCYLVYTKQVSVLSPLFLNIQLIVFFSDDSGLASDRIANLPKFYLNTMGQRMSIGSWRELPAIK